VTPAGATNRRTSARLFRSQRASSLSQFLAFSIECRSLHFSKLLSQHHSQLFLSCVIPLGWCNTTSCNSNNDNDNNNMSKLASLLVKLALAGLALVAAVCQAADDDNVVVTMDPIPFARRIEGRLMLEYVDGDKRVQNKLAYTEVTDDATQRSKVSIGHVSYEPSVYYARGKTVLTVNSVDKRCVKLPDGSRFLPEFDFFMRYTYTDAELDEAQSKFKADCKSPTALLLMHMNRPVSSSLQSRWAGSTMTTRHDRLID
jgi:hypothetical protein